MIITNIKGGLGNQMFQYACGRTLALKNQDKLFLVRHEHTKDILRPFSLANFNITAGTMSAKDVPIFKKLLSKVTQKLSGNYHVGFDPTILTYKGNVYLDGYFQSEKYFHDIADTIRNDFTLRTPFIGNLAEISERIQHDEHAVSIHIRRGDYTNHLDFGGIATKEYYEQATARMRELHPHARFYIFSDDIAWCQKKLPFGSDAVFVSNAKHADYEELILMSQCKHHINANASFSWWGAWLGSNMQKIVIAPKRWSNLHENWYRDIVPVSWIRM